MTVGRTVGRPAVVEGITVRETVGGTAVVVGDGAPPSPPQATATVKTNTREARASFTSLMLLSRPARGY